MSARRASPGSRARRILARLKKAYPDRGPTLDFRTPWELLVALILAAQNTDENTNRITKDLFRKHRGPADFLKVPQEELERDIHGSGYFRQKAKALRAAALAVVERHGGEVPGEMRALLEIPGVGRKTASILLGAAFGVPAIGVDTHVDRVARRLELAPPEEKDRDRIEAALRAACAEKDWIALNWLLIIHGRRTCTARRPNCPGCPVRDLCPWPEKTT